MNKSVFSTSGLFCVDHNRYLTEMEFFNDVEPTVRFQNDLTVYHKAAHVVLFNSGFWALVVAIKYKLAQHKHKKVLMPSLTYRRLADAVFWAGGTPVFVDIDSKSLALDLELCELAIRADKSISVLLLVQPIVGSVDVRPYIGLCNSHHVGLVVDSVESVHDSVAGTRCGAFDAIEVFSCHASKFINGFEGGYICTEDAYEYELLEKLQTLDSIFHFKMSSIHASIASSNLSDIVEFQLHNQKIYNEYIKYQEEFNKIGMDVLKFEKLDQCGYKNIVAKSIDPNLDILKLVSNLNMAGIGARSYYQPPLHRKSHSYPFEIYGSMKITETLGSNMINLPCGWRFKAANVADVFCVIKKQLDGT